LQDARLQDAGECTFTPENGAPIEIRAGDALFFPPNSLGVWDIRTSEVAELRLRHLAAEPTR
jgi:EutQ-like cupin domain